MVHNLDKSVDASADLSRQLSDYAEDEDNVSKKEINFEGWKERGKDRLKGMMSKKQLKVTKAKDVVKNYLGCTMWKKGLLTSWTNKNLTAEKNIIQFIVNFLSSLK